MEEFYKRLWFSQTMLYGDMGQLLGVCRRFTFLLKDVQELRASSKSF